MMMKTMKPMKTKKKVSNAIKSATTDTIQEVNIVKTFPKIPDEYNIFWDMDGVLVLYDESFYKPVDKDNRPTINAPINQLGTHIFLDTKPCNNTVLAVQTLYDLSENSKLITHILTGVNPTIVMTEHVLDKFVTITDMLPDFKRSNIHIAPSGLKTDYIEKFLGRHINEKDILIDDYPKNLKKWQSKGGSAVKALNDFNVNHGDFDFIDTRDDYMKIIDDLFQILARIDARNR